MMMKIQKKSLEHASNILKKFDTYPIYHAISDTLNKLEISNEKKSLILNVVNNESYKLKQISDDAKNWINAVIKLTANEQG